MGQDLCLFVVCGVLHLCKTLVDKYATIHSTCQVCGLISTTQSIRSAYTTCHRPHNNESILGRSEMDTHADTCALGRNFVRLHTMMQTASVSPYNNKYEPVNDVPIVTGATVVQLPKTGETVTLVINQALWFGDTLPNSLLNLNQLWHYGTDIQDNPFDRQGLYIAADDGTQIPMTSLGTTILFESRTPTQSELETFRHINLTLDVE